MININTKNNKIYGYLIILLSLFILVLFTKGEFEKIQISLDEKIIEENNLTTIRNKVEELNLLENKYSSLSGEVQKYIVEFNENEIIDYIYSEIEKENMGGKNGIALIRSLSIEETVVNEIGFNETNLVLNLRVPSEDRLKNILNFFIKENSKYKFFVEYLSLNNSTNSETGFNISIPLKIFYK